MYIKEKRLILTDREKQQIGIVCANCHSSENLQYHHIVPIALGGSNLLSNFVCLCYDCHKTIHTGVPGINYNTLGMNGTRKNGRPKIQKEDLSKDLIQDIQEHKLNITEISKKYGYSRKTIYKYKKIVEEAIN